MLNAWRLPPFEAIKTTLCPRRRRNWQRLHWHVFRIRLLPTPSSNLSAAFANVETGTQSAAAIPLPSPRSGCLRHARLAERVAAELDLDHLNPEQRRHLKATFA